VSSLIIQERSGDASSSLRHLAVGIPKQDLFKSVLLNRKIHSDVLRCKCDVESISQYPTEASVFVSFSSAQIMHKTLKAA
jgi:hypothetical protein